MPLSRDVQVHLAREALALRERLGSLMPFDLHMTTLPAASISAAARRRIDEFIERGRSDVGLRIEGYLRGLARPAPGANDEEQQRHLTQIRMRAGSLISRFDLFADVLTQRSEHRVGIWLAGLECAAEDAIEVPGLPVPPVVCYLDRGSGAAIRRARTRLPGGERNPVALVRIPRERMIGSGVGSSLVHEVGHQGSALLDLIPSIQPVLAGLASQEPRVWSLWSRWIGEILADFWSVARVGPTAVLGMMTVVSVPKAFVFRVGTDDPHPFPYIRVRLACAMADELYPHPQWARLDRLWRRLYPPTALDRFRSQVIGELERTLRALARLIAEHRVRRLGGRTLREVLVRPGLAPRALLATFARWRTAPSRLAAERPCRALAVLDQAKACGRLGPAQEARALEQLFTSWALRRARHETNVCTRPAA